MPLYVRCFSLSHTYTGKRGYPPWENSLPGTTTNSYTKYNLLTTSTSQLNHSLALAEAREERENLLSEKQKREADHSPAAIYPLTE